LKICIQSEKSEWLIKRYFFIFRIIQALYEQEININNNKDFDATSILGFKSKEKYYVIDYILSKPDQDI